MFFAQTSAGYGQQGTVAIAGTMGLLILALVAAWKIFTKAGHAGWKSLIPIYNIVITLRIVGLSGWYTLLYFIPFVNIIFTIIVLHRLSKSFGYGIGMTLLQLVLLGSLIIAFGNSRYVGPNGVQLASGQTPPAQSVSNVASVPPTHPSVLPPTD